MTQGKPLVALVVVFVIGTALAAPKPPVRPLTPAQLDAVAKGVIGAQAKKLEFDDRLFLKDRVTRFGFTNADKVQLANDAASEAALVIATGGNPALALSLCAEAVRQAPGEARVVGNFGELMHLTGQLREAVAVLATARSLDPKAVSVVTNYGNALFELGDQKGAEQAWRDAIALDETYAQAHEGLVALYLARHDVPKAIDELFKAAQYGVSTSMGNALGQVREAGTSAPIPLPPGVLSSSAPAQGGAQAGAASAGAGAAEASRPRVGPRDRLVIPDLPNWPDRLAFVASLPSLQPLVQDIVEGGLAGSLAFAERYYGGAKPPGAGGTSQDPSPTGGEADTQGDADEGAEPEIPVDRGGEAGLPAGTPGGPFSRQPLFELELMNVYLADQLKQALEPYTKKGDAASKKMAKGLEQVASVWPPKIQAALARGDNAGAKQAMADCSKAARVIADKFFADWRDGTREGWARSKQALELYWVYTDGILGRIYDQAAFDFAQDVRRTTVKAALLPLAIGLTTQASGMAIADVACLAPASGVPPEPAQQAVQKLQVPGKKKEKCPFDGTPGLAAGPYSFKFDCDAVEYEFGEGVIVKFRRNFKTGEITLGVGVGVKVGVIGGQATAKVMLDTTFSSDGRVKSVSVNPTAGVSGAAGMLKGGVTVGSGMSVDLHGRVDIKPPKLGGKVGLGSAAPKPE